jgi:hypothetical protein
MHRWIVWSVVAWWAGVHASAQPEPAFTRPGPIVTFEVLGEAQVLVDGKARAAKVEERMRAEVALRTARRSALGLEFGNGTLVRLGSDTELVVEEFWQQPHSQSGKVADWKEEPSPSRARLRLVNGDVSVNVKPLKAARGSTFAVETIAGTLRSTGGLMTARLQMTELGVGLCTLHLQQGSAEWEPVSGPTVRLPLGKPLLLEVELNRASGNVRVSEAQLPDATKK